MPKIHGHGAGTSARARGRAGAQSNKTEPAKTDEKVISDGQDSGPLVPSQLDSSPPVEDGPVTRQEFENFKADVMKELAKKANSSSLSAYAKKTAKKSKAK